MIDRTEHWMRRVSEAVALIGMAVVLAMVLYTGVDVLLRWLFNAPLPGAVDVVSYGLGFAVAAVMPYGFVNNDHVSVSLLQDALPPRGRALLTALVGITCTIFMAGLTYRTWIYAFERKAVGDTMWILGYQVWPVWVAIAALFTLTVAMVALIPILAVARAILGFTPPADAPLRDREGGA